jgi:AmiR/NasT family two-component response regulator
LSRSLPGQTHFIKSVENIHDVRAIRFGKKQGARSEAVARWPKRTRPDQVRTRSTVFACGFRQVRSFNELGMAYASSPTSNPLTTLRKFVALAGCGVGNEGRQPMPGEITTAPPVRIIAADPQAEMRVHYQTVLPELGYRLLSTAATGRELIENCRQQGPDLVIADCNLPGVDVVDAAEEICKAGRVPFIFTADHFDPQQISRSGADHFWAFLIKPINRGHLEAVIPFVAHRFKKMQAFLQELESLRLQAKSGPCFQPEVG